jgi:hypothetical protein
MTTLSTISGTVESAMFSNTGGTHLHRIRVLVALIRLTSLDFIDTLSAPGPLPKAVPS